VLEAALPAALEAAEEEGVAALSFYGTQRQAASKG